MLVIAVLCATLACFALSPAVLSSLLVFQAKHVTSYADMPQELSGAHGQLVAFLTPSGKKIYGYYYELPGAQRTVLLHHGQGGNISTHIGLVKMILAAGFSVLAYDYEGFGMSQGSPSNEALKVDAEAAYDYLVNNKHVNPSNLIDCGVSLGTAAAAAVATSRRFNSVVLISPFASLNQVFIDHCFIFQWYPKFLFPSPDIGSLQFLETNSKTPVLLIHGALDGIINVRHAKQLYAAAKSPCSLIIEPKTHHGDFSTNYLSRQIKDFGLRNRCPN